MKATIHNITVEGTPEEIAQFVKLMDTETNAKKVKEYIPFPQPVIQPYTQPFIYTKPTIAPNTDNPYKWCEVTCDGTTNYQVYN